MFAASLGLVSYCNTNSGDTASIVNSVLGSSIIESSVISMKKEQCYMGGLNKSIDLSAFFEFKGSMSINNLEFTNVGFEESKEIIFLSGHTITSVGYDKTSLFADLKKDASFISSFHSKTIYIRILNPEDIDHSFSSSNTGTSKMNFGIKKDGSFLFAKTAGIIPKDSFEVNVTEANIEGTHKLGEDGIFVFIPKTSSYCSLKATIEYDKTDGGEYHLNVFTPLDKTNIGLNGFRFDVAK